MFDMAYHYREAVECQTVQPARLIYLRTALAHATLATSDGDVCTPIAIGNAARRRRAAQLNVKLYRDERAGGR